MKFSKASKSEKQFQEQRVSNGKQKHSQRQQIRTARRHQMAQQEMKLELCSASSHWHLTYIFMKKLSNAVLRWSPHTLFVLFLYFQKACWRSAVHSGDLDSAN